MELKRLSDMQWACQYSSLWAIKRALPAILETKSLTGLIDGQFVLHVIMLESIFSLTITLSDHLQATDLELASATDLVCYEKCNVDT